jgi:hypothetical protein
MDNFSRGLVFFRLSVEAALQRSIGLQTRLTEHYLSTEILWKTTVGVHRKEV